MPASILSPEEVAAYRRDGYIVPRFRLAGEELAGLQQAVADLAEDNPTLLDQSIVGAAAAEPNARGREPALSVETPQGRVFPVDDDALRAELEQLADTPLFLLHTFRGVPDIAPFSLFNLALADEIEKPAHARQRFTVGY